MGQRQQTRKAKPGGRLFNDNPRGAPRTRGIGYGTAARARRGISLIRGKDVPYQRQVATTMYHRAKYHKYQTQGMREAMKVWGAYRKQLEKMAHK